MGGRGSGRVTSTSVWVPRRTFTLGTGNSPRVSHMVLTYLLTKMNTVLDSRGPPDIQH